MFHRQAALWGTCWDLEGDAVFLVTPCAAQVFALGVQLPGFCTGLGMKGSHTPVWAVHF